MKAIGLMTDSFFFDFYLYDSLMLINGVGIDISSNAFVVFIGNHKQ